MSVNLPELRAQARNIKQDYPNLRVGSTVNRDMRGDLEYLANLCGMPANVVEKANSTDLISVYLVAMKDGAAAVQTAAKVTARLAPFDPFAPPTKERPSEAATPNLDMVRDLIKREVRDGALDPLQRALEATDASLRSDFRDLLRASSEQTLEIVQTRITSEASAAAIEAVRALTPTKLDVAFRDAPAVPLGLVHRDTAEIIEMLADGVNVYLHGPAGSGKTTVARKCAEALGLQFYFAAKVESEYLLLGFKDAKGETVRTQFREAYEHGGVFLFDEMDASASSAIVAINAALANGVCPFPDGIVSRHPDFYCIGAGNTKLTGATRQYAGRNQLDAASIDRFAFHEFGYDEQLETALATDKAWAAHVQRVRAVIAERGLGHLVSPRATIDGCKLLASGKRTWAQVAAKVIWKGLDDSIVAQIEAAL